MSGNTRVQMHLQQTFTSITEHIIWKFYSTCFEGEIQWGRGEKKKTKELKR